MTTNEIIAKVRKKILETTDDVIADAELYDYATEANQDLRIRVFPNQDIESASISFTNGVGSLPSDFGTLYGDPVDSNKNPYPEMPINDFARSLSGPATTIEGGQIKVLPTSIASLTIRYYPIFETLSASQNPTINTYFHELIIYGILMRVYEDLQDEALSKYYEDKYERQLALKSENFSNYEEGNQRGGQMFNEINILGGGYYNDPNRF